ncbi:hypothetical protein [Emergencia timonensis]|uniref:hypothetical protein n=2 Tax=Emergencia timonensis TaxID=1776384 RepID=UPI003993B932
MNRGIKVTFLSEKTLVIPRSTCPSTIELMGLVALAFINFGGIFTVRRVPILASLPVYVITAVAIYSFVKLFFTKNNHILTHEGVYQVSESAEDN